MKRLGWLVIVMLTCGCRSTSGPPGVSTTLHRPVVRTAPSVLESFAQCNFDVITIPRSTYHRLEELWSTTETGGVFGPDQTLLELNGIRVARTDMRFREQFTKTLGAIRSDPQRRTYVRLLEGREQTFDIGEVLSDETLFVYPRQEEVIGRHFNQVRYRMRFSLDRVRKDKGEFKISWQARTGLGLSRTAAIPSLDVSVELEVGQSLVVAPADFRGRGVGRAFLSGLDEAAVEVTFIVITPSEIREATRPPDDRAAATPGPLPNA